jgi:hypothetical protein
VFSGVLVKHGFNANNHQERVKNPKFPYSHGFPCYDHHDEYPDRKKYRQGLFAIEKYQRREMTI